jgi:hypothetical protein
MRRVGATRTVDDPMKTMPLRAFAVALLATSCAAVAADIDVMTQNQ